MAEYKLELRGVCKSFPGVKALDNVQLSLSPYRLERNALLSGIMV